MKTAPTRARDCARAASRTQSPNARVLFVAPERRREPGRRRPAAGGSAVRRHPPCCPHAQSPRSLAWNRELRSLPVPVPVPRGPRVACCVLHAGSLIRRAIDRSAHHEATQYSGPLSCRLRARPVARGTRPAQSHEAAATCRDSDLSLGG